MLSPDEKLKLPRLGSVVSGFISFSHVIMLNSRAAIVVYVESPSRLLAIAVPKYRPDCAAAAPSVDAADADWPDSAASFDVCGPQAVRMPMDSATSAKPDLTQGDMM